MLPIVNVIEAARVLKMEFFSEKLEAVCNEALRDLKIESRCARLEAIVTEPARDLKIEVFSTKLVTDSRLDMFWVLQLSNLLRWLRCPNSSTGELQSRNCL